MNPYDFARVDYGRLPERGPAPPHDRFLPGARHGWLTGTITVETPLFIKQSTRHTTGILQPAQRPVGTLREYLIPGPSLKGLIRSVFETVTQSCFTHGAPWPLELPGPFQPCQDPHRLCPACRVFGWLNHGDVSAGWVSLSEAKTVPQGPEALAPAVWSLPTAGPKPEHRAFYTGDPQSNRPLGRKFYFHQHWTGQPPQVAAGAFPPQKPINQHIQPVAARQVFTFRAGFENLAPRDFDALVYALCLEEGMAHKLGFAKSAGLGSVTIRLTELVFRDPRRRYRGQGGEDRIEPLDAFVAETRQRFVAEAPVPPLTLDSLRRVWRWPAWDVPWAYPGRDWFDDHPTLTLAEFDPQHYAQVMGSLTPA